MNKLIEEIEKLFKQEDLHKCRLQFEESGFCCYIHEDDIINMDLEILEKQHLEFVRAGVINCPFDEYATITFLHEVGHAKDSELANSKVEKRRIRKLMCHSKTEREFNFHLNDYMKQVLTVEEKAWNYVIEKNLPGLNEEVIKVSNHCLKLYEDSRRDIEHYFKPEFIQHSYEKGS